MTFAELRVDVVILCCAVSAGIHAALVPAHFEEGTGPGVGFILASVAPAACAVLLTRRPSRLALAVYRGGLRRADHQLPDRACVWAARSASRARAGRGPRRLDEGDRGHRPRGGGRLPAATGRHPRRQAGHHVSTGRPIPLPLTLLVAVFSALVALAVSGGMHMGTHDHDHAHGITVHVTHGTARP